MKFFLTQSFVFESAHTLLRHVPVSEYAGSRRIHGHTFTAEVTIAGGLGAEGMLEVAAGKKSKQVDLFYLRESIERVRAMLDHQFLDDVESLGPATLENLCVFIAREVGMQFPIHSVQVSRQTGDKCLVLIESNQTKDTP